MIETPKGNFQNLAQLRLAFLKDHHGCPPVNHYFREGEWDDTHLHLSKIATCPRQQMLRYLGTKPKPKGIQREANEELMFWQGNMVHALTVGALDWCGMLHSFEEKVSGLPDHYSGHYDCIYSERMEGEHLILWDGKTVRPNAFDYAYDWPKEKDKRQNQSYLRFTPATSGEVEYIDRGGSNTPQTFRITRDDSWVDLRMTMLLDTLELLPELPDPLPHEYQLTFRKVANEPLHLRSAIWWKRSWECEWCDYLYGIEDKKSGVWTIDSSSPCKPDMTPKVQVAKFSKNKLAEIDEKHVSDIVAWLQGQLEYWYDEPSTEE